jgi:hypothetical protein
MPQPPFEKSSNIKDWAQRVLHLVKKPDVVVNKAVGEAVHRSVPQIAAELGRKAVKTVGPSALMGAGTGAAAGAVGGGVKEKTPGGAGRGAMRGALAGAAGGMLGRATGPSLSRAAIGGAAAGLPAGYLFTRKPGGRDEIQRKEATVKNHYAGVTLDFYDDNGDTLKQKFPTAAALPDVIKTADIRAKDSLDQEDFALVAIDGGNVMRKFACHDPGTTAMSVIYFMEHGDKLPEEAQKTAAVNLVVSCARFNLDPPKALEKIAALDPEVLEILLKGPLAGAVGGGLGEMAVNPDANLKHLGLSALGGAAAGLIPGGATRNASIGALSGAVVPALSRAIQNSRLQKSASVDITGQRPKQIIKVAKPMNDNDYAVVLPDGRRLYPINSWDLVKKAEDYYHLEGCRMQPEIRRQYATKLAAKAEVLGYPLDEQVKEAGARTYAEPGHIRASIEMRKVACAEESDKQFLEDLFTKQAALDPNTYAECLRRFDVNHGFDYAWDQEIPSPWASTFGLQKTAEVLWEEGADRMTREQLINMAENHTSGIQELFSHDFLREFIKDPVAVFNSLPLPNKRILARLSDQMSHAGGSEGSGTKNETMRA